MEILNDFNTTVRKALNEIDPLYESYPGLVICGTHTPHDVDEMLYRIRVARESGDPFLGICFGHQLAAIEYARNVIGQKGATSEELFDLDMLPRDDLDFSQPDFVVRRRPEGLKVGLHEGESWWNKYEVVEGFESVWKKPENFITVQFHPEYQSSKDKPHPILKQFIELCKK